jgi:hypothetical protein
MRDTLAAEEDRLEVIGNVADQNGATNQLLLTTTVETTGEGQFVVAIVTMAMFGLLAPMEHTCASNNMDWRKKCTVTAIGNKIKRKQNERGG